MVWRPSSQGVALGWILPRPWREERARSSTSAAPEFLDQVQFSRHRLPVSHGGDVGRISSYSDVSIGRRFDRVAAANKPHDHRGGLAAHRLAYCYLGPGLFSVRQLSQAAAPVRVT